MDRALNIGLLSGALDQTANLPSPEELRGMLAEAEVAVFFRSELEIGDQLLETAWNLHHVGTARPQLAIYPPARQIQANAVAAHIFDLALQADGLDLNLQLPSTPSPHRSAQSAGTGLPMRLPWPDGCLRRRLCWPPNRDEPR